MSNKEEELLLEILKRKGTRIITNIDGSFVIIIGTLRFSYMVGDINYLKYICSYLRGYND